MMRMYMVGAALVLSIGALMFSGCGGGDDAASGTGGIRVSVKFPERPGEVAPADLPLATDSVKVEVLETDGITALVPAQIAVRGAGVTETLVFPSVPIGNCIVRATAYESDDATGRVIAEAQVNTNIVAGQVTPVTLTTEALVVKVDVLPAVLTLEYLSNDHLTATCYDADDNVVLTSVNWQSSNGNVTVNYTGDVTGEDTGTATVTATHGQSGLSDTCNVTVFKRSVAYVTVEPSEAILNPPQQKTVQLVAKARDASNVLIPYAQIDWSSGDSALATVDNNGLVTSNATSRGNVIITADAGEGTPGTCDISVQPVGGLDVTVQ